MLKSDIKIQANLTQVDVFYSSNINQLLGFESHFSQESNCLIFDKAFLTNQLPTADEIVFRLLKEQCERDVKRQIIKKEKLNSTKILVKELLHGSQDYSVSLNQVALELKTSVRSLQRQLASEETSFQIVLAEARREYAEKLLKSTRLSIQEISNILGYADISHFTRAFKKWVGLTPTIYRKA
ncbi:Transcriptional activator NphR [Acinetobacter venetianus]|nr:Transcriptional activator NphR [Acinetobacter venetianus]